MIYGDFIIRPACNDDIVSVKNVVFEVLHEYGLENDEFGKDSDLNDIERSYFSNNGYFGVVTKISTNHIIGTIGLFSIDRIVCELRKMYLLKEARGFGLGGFILDYSINIAKEKGFQVITLETISVLVEDIVFYSTSFELLETISCFSDFHEN